MIEHYFVPSQPRPASPFTPAVGAGGFVFVSGQTATIRDAIYIGDFDREVNSAIDNVELALNAAGARLEHVVRVGVYLSNATLFAPFNVLYRARFADPAPARTTLVVDFGHADVRVELDAVAYLGR